jgi:glucosamine-6-phosphate deaminase
LHTFHWINAEHTAEEECARLNELIQRCHIDVEFVGIGENGHLAFNDPPADFEIEKSYHVVELDEACRRQQFGEGWFNAVDDVPKQAISMSIPQIMKSNVIICTVPNERMADAVCKVIQGPITPGIPASILQLHKSCSLLFDALAALRLSGAVSLSQVN